MAPPPGLPTPAIGPGALLKDLFKSLFELLEAEPAVRDALIHTIEQVMPRYWSALAEFRLQSKIRLIQRSAALEQEMDAKAEPALLGLAARALQDMFKIPVSVASITPAHSGGNSEAAAEGIGHSLLNRLFGLAAAPSVFGIQPGTAGAERVLDTVLGIALDSWIGDTVGTGWLTDDLPEFSKLKETIQSHIGLGRLAPRALRPLLDIIAATPLERELNRTYTPTLLTPGQLVKYRNSGRMGEEEFFSRMLDHGHSRANAAILLLLERKQLSESAVETAWKQGTIGDGVALQQLRDLGYIEADAGLIMETWRNEQARPALEHLASVARDMFRDREIDESRLRELLAAANYGPDLVGDWVAAGYLERSRPKRLTLTQAVDAFIENAWDEDRLRAYLEAAAYAPEAVELLTIDAARRKAAAERQAARVASQLPPAPLEAVRRSTALELHRRGLTTDEQLRVALEALGIAGARLASEMVDAAARRKEFVAAEKRHELAAGGLHVSAGSLEQLYKRGLVGDQELEAFYTERGFAGEELAQLMQLRRVERAEWFAAHIKPPKPEGAPGQEPLAS